MVVGNSKEKRIIPDLRSLSFLSSFNKNTLMQSSSNSSEPLKEDNIIEAVNSFYYLVSKFIGNNGEIETILPDFASGIRGIFPESNSIASKIEYNNKQYISGDITDLLPFFDYSVFFPNGETLYVQLFSTKADFPNSFEVRLLESFLTHLEDLTPAGKNIVDSHSKLQCAMEIGSFWWWELTLPEWAVSCDESLLDLMGVPEISSNKTVPYESYLNSVHPEDRDFFKIAIEKCMRKE